MTDKKLALLGIIAVLTAAAAVYLGRITQTYQPPAIVISHLIEGLDPGAVGGIRILSDAGKETTDLVRQGNGFVVVQKANYPADTRKVNDLISRCLDLQVSTGERITSDEKNHAELGVTADTARQQVDFLDTDGKLIVGILVSAPDEDQDGASYVRLTASPDVYRVDTMPSLASSASDYLDNSLLQLSRDEIIRVTVTDPNGVSYTLFRPDETSESEIKLENMPAGRQWKGSTYRSIFQSLSYLSFEDVLKDDSQDAKQFNWKYRAKTNDAVVYTIQTAERENDGLVKLSAEYIGPAPSVQQQVESEEQLKEREKRFLAKEKADTFNREHQGWIYKIPVYKMKELTHYLSDLIEPIPAPEAEKSDTSATVEPAAGTSG